MSSTQSQSYLPLTRISELPFSSLQESCTCVVAAGAPYQFNFSPQGVSVVNMTSYLDSD
jgi:hypothetical protein